MHGQVHPVQPGWVSYAITIGLLVIVMALRLRRMGKMRPLNLGRLWIVPALYAAIAAAMFIASPFSVPIAIASIAGLIVGATLGWMRGKMMHIEVDPETHALNQKASPAALFFLVALMIVRGGARSVLGQSGSVSPAMLTDPLIAFALGLLALTRVEMYLRAKRLLGEARGRA
ncbi:MAG TPA: CcdC protein domain-containing protein [Sphingomicrobium sp.]|nr:CcdC protein domain-containing protein [Sphingomicrobium sp.]